MSQARWQGFFDIYQTLNSNSIYNYCILNSCFKEFDQIGKSSDMVIKIQQTNHKFISTQK